MASLGFPLDLDSQLSLGVSEEQTASCSPLAWYGWHENPALTTLHHWEFEVKKCVSQLLNVSQLRQPFRFCSFLFINTFPTSSRCTELEEPKLVLLDLSQLQTSFKFSQV